MKELDLLNISIILQTIRKYPTYEVYPYVFYVNRFGEILDVPSKENMKVETWIIPFIDGVGLVVQRIGNKEVVLRAYEITDRVEEKNELIEGLFGRLVRLVNNLDIENVKILDFNSHVIEGISVALGLEKDIVSQTINEAKIRQKLEDRTVAIFNDIVILLSKRKFMIRYDGKNIVELARRYAFVVDAPISYIAEKHIPTVLGDRVAVFVFPESSIICNPVTCYNMPLPSNLSYLIARKVPKSLIIDLDRDKPENYSNKRLPIPYLCIAKNKVLILKREGKDRFTLKEMWKTRVRPVAPLVFSPYGFLGYGKIFVKNNRVIVEVITSGKGEEGREREDTYLEEVVLGS